MRVRLPPNLTMFRRANTSARHFWAEGDIAHAREQLGEVAGRAGTGSVSFVTLKREITAFEAQRG